MSVVPTTLNELRRPVQDSAPVVRAGFGDSAGFELMQRACKALASSTLVPKEYQGNLPNCIIALEMSQRIGASPLQVMQNLYVVHGRPGWSAKFLVATFNQCGRFSAVRYEWTGKQGNDDWGCRAWATEKATGERIDGPLITIALSKKEGWYAKSGSKWQTIPELMLMYRAAAWMINTHAPEISMGLNTAEEMHDTFDARVGGDGTFVIDEVADLRPVVEAEPPADVSEMVEAAPAPIPLEHTTEHLAQRILDAMSVDDLDLVRGLNKERDASAASKAQVDKAIANKARALAEGAQR